MNTIIIDRFPVEYQMDSQDCGPASLKIIAQYYGRFYSLQYLRDQCGISREGVSLLDISNGAEAIGLRTLAIRSTIEELIYDIPLPLVVYWKESHFIVLYKATKKYVYVSDPAKGKIRYTHKEFEEGWLLPGEKKGASLAIEPIANFKQTKVQKKLERYSFVTMLRYLEPYRKQFIIILIIMTLVTSLQAILPFISKAVIDTGIKTSDIKFINMVLIGNITILLSITIFNIVRDWILMHITSRVNIV